LSFLLTDIKINVPGLTQFLGGMCVLFELLSLFYEVLLTVHRSIFISPFNQLDVQNLFHN